MPVDWLQVPLGEVCRIEIGGTPSRNVPRFWADKHSGYPWLSIADLKASRVYDTAERITDAGVRNSNVKPIPANTPVMSFKLTIGRAAVAGVNMYSNEAIAAFHADSTVIAPGWLFYELPRAALRGISDTAVKGSTLNKAKLRKLPLELPPLPEQRQIAEILDTLDEAIRKTEQVIAKLQQVKQGLLHDLLTRGIDDNGELRDPDRHPEQFKDSLLGRIPKGWEVCPACEVCSAVIDCKNRTPPVLPEGHPVIRTPNIRDGEFVAEGLVYTDPNSYEAWTQRGKPRGGDVLITREAPVGEVCLLPTWLGPACLGQRMMMYQTDPRQLRSDFMVVAILSPAVQKALRDAAGGSTVGHVRVADIRSLLLPIPPLGEQGRIAFAWDGNRERLRHESTSLSKLRLLKSGLMEDLLTGRVRVTKLLEQAAE